jgi:hypothetical protein
MNVCELRITGVDRDAVLAAARWELFVFPNVIHVHRIACGDRVAILYEGSGPDVQGWIEALGKAGYAAESLEPAGRALKAV